MFDSADNFRQTAVGVEIGMTLSLNIYYLKPIVKIRVLCALRGEFCPRKPKSFSEERMTCGQSAVSLTRCHETLTRVFMFPAVSVR